MANAPPLDPPPVTLLPPFTLAFLVADNTTTEQTAKERVYGALRDNPHAKLNELMEKAKVSKPTAIAHRRTYFTENERPEAPDVDDDQADDNGGGAASPHEPPKGPEPSGLHEAFPPAPEDAPKPPKPTDDQVKESRSRTIYLQM